MAASPEEVSLLVERCGGRVVIAAVNSPCSVVVSGDDQAVARWCGSASAGVAYPGFAGESRVSLTVYGRDGGEVSGCGAGVVVRDRAYPGDLECRLVRL